MRTGSMLITVAVALTAGCSSGPPPERPTPQPTEAEIAWRIRTRDSLAALSRAAADSAEQVRQVALAARARTDSLERVRLASETAARHAAEASTELRQELGVMVHFGSAQSALGLDSRIALDRKVAILNANPAVRLQITGACDERGSDRYNVALGNRRAMAVRAYLISKGIDAGRLDGQSAGEKSPIDTGRGEGAWAQNRRAEFVVMSSDLLLAMK